MSDATQQLAELQKHHIEGYALAAQRAGKTDADAYFDVPLISHIHRNLWMGGVKDLVRLPSDFVSVISLYPWERYAIGEKTERFEFKMYDGEGVDGDEVDTLAALVNDSCDKGKTLVHCQAGLNRSGLVCGRSLILAGYHPTQAIALLRARRSPLVLCNQVFEQWLLSSLRGTT